MTVEATNAVTIETGEHQAFLVTFRDGIALGRFLTSVAQGFKDGQLDSGSFRIQPNGDSGSFAVSGRANLQSGPRIIELAALAKVSPNVGDQNVGEMYEG